MIEERVIRIINRIRKIYFVFFCLGSIDLIFAVSEGVPLGEILERLISTFLYFVIYIGLKFRNRWLIPLVLMSSAWLLVSTLFSMLQPAVDIRDLVAKGGGIMLVIFCAYQMHFFSKREVRESFGVKATIFF